MRYGLAPVLVVASKLIAEEVFVELEGIFPAISIFPVPLVLREIELVLIVYFSPSEVEVPFEPAIPINLIVPFPVRAPLPVLVMLPFTLIPAAAAPRSQRGSCQTEYLPLLLRKKLG